MLQIKRKIPRGKAISSLEEKVINILTEIGYVSKEETLATTETLLDLFDDEDEDEEVVVDGEVDEGDVHIRPISRKSTPLVSHILGLDWTIRQLVFPPFALHIYIHLYVCAFSYLIMLVIKQPLTVFFSSCCSF